MRCPLIRARPSIIPSGGLKYLFIGLWRERSSQLGPILLLNDDQLLRRSFRSYLGVHAFMSAHPFPPSPTGDFGPFVMLTACIVRAGRRTAQCLLRPLFVVVAAPGFDLGACMLQAGKPVLIETFVTQALTGRFNVGLLV